VLIVSVDELGEVAVARHAAAIEAARAAGTRRIRYTSHMGVRPDSPFAAAPDHAATEALLRDSGILFTSLRNGFYVNTARMLVGEALRTGTLTASSPKGPPSGSPRCSSGCSAPAGEAISPPTMRPSSA